MTKRHLTDVGASVRQRLYNHAQASRRPFQEVLQYFAMERFLYRLSRSAHADKFVLKGALMFTVWRSPSSRPTNDIDLLARTSNNIDSVVSIVRNICQLEVEPDGLIFDVDTVHGLAIKEDADYEGVRVTFLAHLQNAKIHMQLDMGFGDVLSIPPAMTQYPTILDLAPPQLLGYSRETAVAEKFEAMVKLGQINSRMKDFFDIWLLSRQFDFDGIALADAITQTFAHRSTEISVSPFALTPEFALDPVKAAQWSGFLRKSRITVAPDTLSQTIDALATFLLPVAHGVYENRAYSAHWNAPGPWKALED